eukprot:PITA_33533
MPGIDPTIVVHEIKTYPDTKPVRQRLRQIHPRKATAIKAEVEKLLKSDSKAGIRVDPSKVEAIIKLPPPSSLHQLQSLQGKANFLRRFIPNYAEITKGFTWLLKQNTSFFWDEIAEKSFDALKHALTHAPLLHPPNYNQDYYLYLAASYSTIGIVLVQED